MLERRIPREADYGSMAKMLHWLILGLLVAQYGVAWTMPEIHRGTQPDELISLHLSIGILILCLIVLRTIWRFSHPLPLIADNVPDWQRLAAQIVHGILYLLLVAMPLMGWANASARGWRMVFFGFVPLPPILPTGSPLGRELGDLHVLASYALLAFVGLHTAAALYHHFWLRDRVLLRMLPGGD